LSTDESVASIHQVIDFLGTFRSGQPTDLESWTRAVATGVKLAGYDEAEQRRDRFNEARFASGMAADGGMRDKTIAAALGLAGVRPPPALARSM
jgi:hypothetical protein